VRATEAWESRDPDHPLGDFNHGVNSAGLAVARRVRALLTLGDVWGGCDDFSILDT